MRPRWRGRCRCPQQHDGLRFAERVVHVPPFLPDPRPLSPRAGAGAGSGRWPTRRSGRPAGPDRPPLVQPRVAPAQLRPVSCARPWPGNGARRPPAPGRRGRAASRPGRKRQRGRGPGSSRGSLSGPAAPKRLRTARKLVVPEAARRSTTVRSVASSPKGTTNWYCRNPRRPYSRFHDPTASSGWK